MQVSGLCSIAPNRFAQQLGGPREWAWLAKEGIYNLHHEIEPLPLGEKSTWAAGSGGGTEHPVW
jgi:hypothetical protein